MQSLLLKLKAPLQSWSHQSRFRSRSAGDEPTKSGVLGMLAAAQGRRRTDPIEDLVKLEFGVRVDQPGTLERDFQTAVDWRKGPPGTIVTRYYLADAVFVAAVSGPPEVLEQLQAAIASPKYPLYLGRRACPANADLLLGIKDGDVEAALRAEPWHAAPWYRKTKATEVYLPLLRDGRPEEVGDFRKDVPLSYASENRQYGLREVVEVESVRVHNDLGQSARDPFFEAVVKA